MTASNARIAELRQDSERTRAALTATVRELKDKVGDTANEVKTIISPAHIKSEVQNYAREIGSNFVETMSQRAKENPLQAIAAGAAIGFPMLKLLRAVPTPLLLIGAGFWLSTQGGRRAMESATDQASQAMQSAKDTATDMMNSAGETASDLADKGMAMVSDTVSANVTPVVEKARRGLHDARDAATDLGRTMADKAAAISGSTASAAVEASHSTRDSIANAGSAVQSSVADLANKNPLLTAALGIAAGAFLAASLPTSSAEQRVLGASSSRVKRAGRQALNDTLDKAADIAEQTLSSAGDAARREGLGPDRLRAAADDITAKAKAVAEKGIQAAMNGVNEHKGENR
jgi:ElaB/YqjD/DUF883 family membrane-anchored ribosome-binding protein